MVVVVGKPKYPTPMMTAFIRFASLNPYWYVPPDLASERIAPNVLRQGLKYLDRLGYQVLLTGRRRDGHRPQDDRLEGRCRRQGGGPYPAASRPRTIRWGG